MKKLHVHIARISATALVFSMAIPSLVLAQNPASSSVGPVLPVNQESGVAVMGDFQISPTRFVIEMDPGDEQTVQISLINRGGEPYSYSFHTEDFSANGEVSEDIQLFGKVDGPFSARSWIYTPTSSVRLDHGERTTIPVRVTAPRNAAVGDHYTAFLIQRDPVDAGQGQGFSVISQVGALLLITIRGNPERTGHLESFGSQLPVYWWLPSTLKMQYRNDGNVHLVPRGSVVIRNIFGVVVDEIPIKDWYVLRNSVRKRTILWQPKFALGYYSATLTVQSEANPQPETMSSSFWIIPIVPVLIALIAIFAVSCGVQSFMSRFEIRKKAS